MRLSVPAGVASVSTSFAEALSVSLTSTYARTSVERFPLTSRDEPEESPPSENESEPKLSESSNPPKSSIPSANAEPTVAVTTAPAADIFKVNGNTYKIKGKNATLIKGAKKSKVVIPATVKFNGKKYKVTAIGGSAFKSNKKLKSVTIGKNIKSIGKKAFYKASKLSRVMIKSKLLKSSKVGRYAFKGVSKKVVFKVPAAKRKAYTKIIAKSAKKYTIS